MIPYVDTLINFASLQRGVEKVVKHQVVQLAEEAPPPTLQDRVRQPSCRRTFYLLLLVMLAATHSIRIARYRICITASRIKPILATEAEKPQLVMYERPEISEKFFPMCR
jgi:hypothetical protein